MSPFVARLLRGQPILIADLDAVEEGAVKVVGTQSTSAASISSEQLHFALECLRYMYERTYSRSKSSVFRLSAAHFIVAALESCDISALLSEEVHHTIADMVHNLLKQAPAFAQVSVVEPALHRLQTITECLG